MCIIKKPTLENLEKAADRLHEWNLTFLTIFGALAYYYYRIGRYDFVAFPGTERWEFFKTMHIISTLLFFLVVLYVCVRTYEFWKIAEKEGLEPTKVWWNQLKARLKWF